MVVNAKDVESNYFTISAQGIVNVQTQCDSNEVNIYNKTQTEFFTLSEWMHQSSMFNVLTSMKFFK